MENMYMIGTLVLTIAGMYFYHSWWIMIPLCVIATCNVGVLVIDHGSFGVAAIFTIFVIIALVKKKHELRHSL